MSIQEKELKGILKSLKAINAALGTVAGADIAVDLQAVITAEGVSNAILDTATAGLVTFDAILDTLVTSEGAVNTIVDDLRVTIGTPAGADSIADQAVLLWAQLE